QRAAIQQLIRNSNATIQDSSEEALTAFYGVPTTRESDPIRAANTGLAIVEQARRGTTIGIGLSFGTVESQSQSDGTETFVPTGQLMSRLSRLQAAAEEGIIADDLMYQLLETRYEFEEGECLQGEPPIYTYQLLSAHNLSSPTIPLIGRHAELELLKADVEKLLLGGSSFILLTGEAGIGKTRLITELRAHYSDAPLFWLQGKCSSDGYFNYAPIIEALNTHLTPGPSPMKERGEAKRDAVDGAMAHQLREELRRFGMERAIPYMADFLSLPMDAISTEAEAKRYQTATAEQIRYRTFMSLRDWLTNMADVHPIVFVVEDFQWVDEPTLELLKYLTKLAAQIPIMFLYVQRRWHEDAFDKLAVAIQNAYSEGYRQIELNRLSREQSRRLLLQICARMSASGVSNTDVLPTDVFEECSGRRPRPRFDGADATKSIFNNISVDIQRHILDRANGNPFYLEEMCRSSFQNRRLKCESYTKEIPHSIQSAILSRVDQLDPIRKSVVQYAAVLGESFRPSILARLFPQVNIEKTLTMLTNSDFIQSVTESDLIQFKHSLIQEAILKSIAPTSRRQIHHEIAQTLEKFHKEQIEHFSTMLAHHYHFAGDGEKALEYALKAARYHARTLEYRQAARCYRIALAHESTLSDKERYETYMELGECLRNLHQMEEAITIYQKAETLATDKTERALAYIELAHVYNDYIHDWMRDHENAVMYRDKAAALVDEGTDTESIVKIFDNSIQSYGLSAPRGTTRQAGDNFISELLRSLEIIRGRNAERAEVKLLLAIAARLYPHDAGKSLAYQQQALSIAQKIGDDSLLGHLFFHLADIMLEHDNRQSLAFAQEALRRYEKMGDALAVVDTYGIIGRAYYLLGNTEKSIAAYEQMLKFDWLFDVWRLGVGCLALLVQNYVQRGDLTRARKMFFQMLNLIRKHPNKAQSMVMENAAASLCYGGVMHDTTSWMRENISSTIERGCEFVA
ncbi:MAG: AAA family ATPase, partial [Candidatus Poribacteria bacterium]